MQGIRETLRYHPRFVDALDAAAPVKLYSSTAKEAVLWRSNAKSAATPVTGKTSGVLPVSSTLS